MAVLQKTQKNVSKRDKILLAAEKIFSEKNFASSQISEIAKTAGVGVGTFYRHFPSKDAVLLALLETLLANIRKELKTIRIGVERFAPIEHIALFRKTFEVVLRAFLSRPQLSLIFLRSAYGANGEVSNIVWHGLHLIIIDIIEDIRRVEETGLINVADKESLSHCILGIILQLVHKILIEGKPTEEQAVNIIMRATLGMFGAYIPNDQFTELAPVYFMFLPPIDKS